MIRATAPPQTTPYHNSDSETTRTNQSALDNNTTETAPSTSASQGPSMSPSISPTASSLATQVGANASGAATQVMQRPQQMAAPMSSRSTMGPAAPQQSPPSGGDSSPVPDEPQAQVEEGGIAVLPPGAAPTVGEPGVEQKEQKDVVLTQVPTGFEKLKPEDNPILKELDKIESIENVESPARKLTDGPAEDKAEDEAVGEEKQLDEAAEKVGEKEGGEKGNVEEVAGDAQGEGDEGAAKAGTMAANQEWANLLLAEPVAMSPPTITKEQRAQAPPDAKLPSDGELFSRANAASMQVSSFIAQGTMQLQGVFATAQTIKPRIQASAAAAKAAIQAKVTEQQGLVTTKIGALKAQAQEKAYSTMGSINAWFAETQATIRTDTETNKAAVKAAYDTALKDVNKAETDQFPKVDKAYTDGADQFKTKSSEVASQARTDQYSRSSTLIAGYRNVDDNLMDGPYTYNKQKAKSDAAKKVGDGYYDGLVKEGEKKAQELLDGPGKANDYKNVKAQSKKARESLQKQYEEASRNLDTAQTQALDQAAKAKSQMISSASKALETTMKALEGQEGAQIDMLSAFGVRQEAAIDRDMLKAVNALEEGVNQSVTQLLLVLQTFKDELNGGEMPDEVMLQETLATATAEFNASVQHILATSQSGISATTQGIASGAEKVSAGLADMAQKGVAEAKELAAGINPIMENLAKGANTGFQQMKTAHKKSTKQTADIAVTNLKGVATGLATIYTDMDGKLKEGLKNNAKQLKDGFKAAVDKDMLKKSKEEEGKAAAQVQPRWKSVLKILLVIVVIVVVALVVGPAVIGFVAGAAGALGASAAAASVIGAVVGGAIVGAAAGGVIQMGNNVIDGKNVMDGVGKAMIVGAIGGALGGAGGALGQVITKGAAGALPALTRFGVDMAFDVGGGILGDLAVGNPITMEGILFGAAMGAGMSVGMGGLGALKGTKLDVGGFATKSTDIQANFMAKGETAGMKFGGATPDAPKIDAPDVSAPTAPKVEAPAAPKVETPAAPKAAAPEPAVPKASPEPAAPKTDAPSADAPTAPKTEAPAAPKSETPSAPKAEAPQPPKTESTAPKADEPSAPKPVDQPTGKPQETVPKADEPAPKQAKADADKKPNDADIEASAKTKDGHEAKVDKDGDLYKCSECSLMQKQYESELADPKNAKLKEELDTIEAMPSQTKAQQDAKAKALADWDAKMQQAQQKGPVSGKKWDDPTLTAKEVYDDYKAANPNTKFTGPNDPEFQARFTAGDRVNPETGALKNPANVGRPKPEIEAKFKEVDPETGKPIAKKLPLEEVDPEIKKQMDANKKARDKAIEQRDDLAGGKDDPNYGKENKKVIDKSEQAGELAADAHMKKEHGAEPLHTGSGSGDLDKVYKVGDKYYVVESKGGGSGLGSRQTPAGRAEQGTSDYLKSVVDDMKAGKYKDLPDGHPLKKFLDDFDDAMFDGNVKYLLAKQKFDADGKLLPIEVLEFDL